MAACLQAAVGLGSLPMIVRSALISAALCGFSLADVSSGKERAALLAATSTYETGRPLQAAIRLTVDPGWHTYWGNPGEGGMKISVKWELPDGWRAEELEEPVPKRFMTGELAGFGYEGVVIFPVKLIPGGEAKGDVKITGKVSWLTCNDDACIPGDANLELDLTSGSPEATTETALIGKALEKIPKRNPEITLGVKETGHMVHLILSEATTKPFKASDYEFFPRTPRIIDPAATFEFKKMNGSWVTDVPKNEYAPEKIVELTLVLAGKNGEPPQALTWKAAPVAEDKN